MDRLELERRIKKTIRKHLGVAEDDVKNEANLCTDLGADSLDIAELILDIEEEFYTAIPEDECSSINTVGDLIAVSEKYIKDLY